MPVPFQMILFTIYCSGLFSTLFFQYLFSRLVNFKQRYKFKIFHIITALLWPAVWLLTVAVNIKDRYVK